MKQKIRKFSSLSFILAICIIILPGENSAKAAFNQMETSDIKVVEQALDEAKNENKEDIIGIGVISIQNDIRETFLSERIYENASIVGDGVRLRKKPNQNAEILELMYNNETVCINYTKSKGIYRNWLYVKRVKTGTWGWVKQIYVYEWD